MKKYRLVINKNSLVMVETNGVWVSATIRDKEDNIELLFDGDDFDYFLLKLQRMYEALKRHRMREVKIEREKKEVKQ